MSETFLKQCPRCGSENLEYGNLHTFGRFVGYWAKGFSLPKRVEAVACQNCGHLELVLRNVPNTQKKG
jgi:predicted nucleic-acid-binding Zn-ribbon protein